jgi:hypothetical protein
MRQLMIGIVLMNSAWAQTAIIDDKQLKLQLGSELIIQQYMDKMSTKELDVIFRCSKGPKSKNIKCFVIDKKILK